MHLWKLTKHKVQYSTKMKKKKDHTFYITLRSAGFRTKNILNSRKFFNFYDQIVRDNIQSFDITFWDKV